MLSQQRAISPWVPAPLPPAAPQKTLPGPPGTAEETLGHPSEKPPPSHTPAPPGRGSRWLRWPGQTTTPTPHPGPARCGTGAQRVLPLHRLPRWRLPPAPAGRSSSPAPPDAESGTCLWGPLRALTISVLCALTQLSEASFLVFLRSGLCRTPAALTPLSCFPAYSCGAADKLSCSEISIPPIFNGVDVFCLTSLSLYDRSCSRVLPRRKPRTALLNHVQQKRPERPHKRGHNPRTPAARSTTSQTPSAAFQLSAHTPAAAAVPPQHTQSLTAGRGWVRLPPLHPDTSGWHESGRHGQQPRWPHSTAQLCPAHR